MTAFTDNPPARADEAPPHDISAANLSVIQNDTGNTVNSVTVSSTLSINDMLIRPEANRVNYNLQVGDNPKKPICSTD